MRINQEIRDALSENLSKEQLREMVYKSDVTTLLEDGLNKVLAGLTTFSEILNLIELDNDNRVYEDFNLKQAIDETKETKIAKQQAMIEATTNQANMSELQRPLG